MFCFNIPLLPPSLNNSKTLSTRKFRVGGRLISKKVIVKNDKTLASIKEIKELLFYQMTKPTIDQMNEQLKDSHIKIKFFFFSDEFITKKNKISKIGGDYDGFIKMFQDCIFSFTELNDSQINHAEIFLIHSHTKKSIVKIEKSTIYNDADFSNLFQ